MTKAEYQEHFKAMQKRLDGLVEESGLSRREYTEMILMSSVINSGQELVRLHTLEDSLKAHSNAVTALAQEISEIEDWIEAVSKSVGDA